MFKGQSTTFDNNSIDNILKVKVASDIETYFHIINTPEKYKNIKNKEIYLILENDEVCSECNQNLSILDNHLQKQLDLNKGFLNNIGTKHNKDVIIRNLG